MRVSLIVAIAIVLGGAKPAPEPASLQPTTAWKVDYSSTSCILTRQFTGGGQGYDFELTLTPIEKRAWLRIGSAEKVRKFDSGDAVVEVDGVKLAEPTHFNMFENTKGGATREFLFLQFRRDVGSTGKSLRLIPARHGDFRLDLSDFPDAMQAMNSCMDDLHRSLGVDPATLQAIATEPGGWALDNVDVPRRAFDLTLFYWVASTGRVDDCRVLRPTGIAEFDARVCEDVKKKAQLKPARNAAGTAIRAPVYEHIPMRIETRISTSPL